MFRTAVLTVLIFSAAAGFGQGTQHERIRAAYAAGEYSAAAAELENLRADSPAVFTANNYDYLLARAAEESGDLASAATNYRAVASRRSVLGHYALRHLALIARNTGDLFSERRYLDELSAFSPATFPGDAARWRMAESWFESGNYDLAIDSLSTAGRSTNILPGRDAFRERLALLAEAYYRSGNLEKARETYLLLIDNRSDSDQPDDFALAAARGLDRLDFAGDNAAPPLDEREHLRRAGIYHFNRDFDNARLHYTAIVNNYPSARIVPDVMFRIGRTYSQSSSFADAIRWYELVIEKFPDDPVTAEALVHAASAYTAVGRHAESIRRYQRYIEQFPSGERVERSYLNIIDVLRDSGEPTEALKWGQKTREVFKGKLPEALALFAETRVHMSRNDWTAAVSALRELSNMPDLGGAVVPGGTTRAEVIFMQAFALEQLREYEPAIEAYLSIDDGRGEYYGWRASERLRLLASHSDASAVIQSKFADAKARAGDDDPETSRHGTQDALRLTSNADERRELLDKLRGIYEKLPAYRSVPDLTLARAGRSDILEAGKPAGNASGHQAVADELLFLGLYDEGAREYEAASALENRAPKRDRAYTIALIHSRGNAAHRGIEFIDSVWKAPADYQVELLPRYVSELLYPAPYADILLRQASPANVDPRFLLSLMRQESRFRPGAKSVAAARGLMQFIPSTAKTIAGQVGRERFRHDDLYDPETSILFGTEYVAGLFKLFPNRTEAVAAAYNGGEDNMQRWLARSRSDQADRYVPEIMFSQSKDYVFRVMTNYRMYELFYGADLRRK